MMRFFGNKKVKKAFMFKGGAAFISITVAGGAGVTGTNKRRVVAFHEDELQLGPGAGDCQEQREKK